MKTVQQYLRELDKDILIDKYLPLINEEISRSINKSNENAPIVRQKFRDKISEYIDRLRNLPIKPSSDGKTGLIYIYLLNGDKPQKMFEFANLEDVIELGTKAENYSYLACYQEEIVGFYIAETPLTQRYIYDLMINVMYEASFYGYEDEEKTGLLKTLEEFDNGTAELHEVDIDELFAEISENDSEVDLNYDPSDFSYQYDIDEEVLAEIEDHTNERELNLIQAMNSKT